MASIRGLFGLGNSKPKVSPTESAGASGTALFGGYVQSIETEQSLVGDKRFETFADILLNVDIVAAGVRYFLNLVGAATWKVQPVDEKNSEAVRLAELTEDIMHDMIRSWTSVIRRSAMYKLYGFDVQEWTAKQRPDGVIGYKNISPRPQGTIKQWDTDEEGNVTMIVQRPPQDGTNRFMPREKVIYMVDQSISDSPEGIGLFRHIAPHANILKTYEKLEGVGFETDLRGIPIARAPVVALQRLVSEGVMPQAKADAMLATVETFIENHYRNAKTGFVFDSAVYTTADEKANPTRNPMWDIELLKGDSGSLTDLAAAITRKTHGIARILGVEHLLLGEAKQGSFALSRDKTNNFFLTVNSTLEELAQQYEHDFLLPLWRMNGWDEDLLPELAPEPVQFRDIEQITQTLLDLSQAGAPLDPLDPVVNEIRDLIGVERRDEAAIAMDATLRAPTATKEPEDMEEAEEDESGSGDE